MPAATQVLHSGCFQGVMSGASSSSRAASWEFSGKPLYASVRRQRAREGYGINARRNSCAAAKIGDGDSSEQSNGEKFFEIDEALDKVLQTEESKALLQDLSAAMARVEAAKKAMEELEGKEKESSNASAILDRIKALEETQKAADSQVEVLEGAVESAEAQLRASELRLVQLRAGSSLGSLGKWDSPDIDDDAERVESGKAAAVSALAGAVVSLPFAFASAGGLGLGALLSEGAIVASCALFGVCYRYIVRRDIGNTQLKGGAVGAFALTRGLAQLDTTQLLVGLTDDAWDKLPKAAMDAGESFIIFAFAAVALDYCMRQRLLDPFPSSKK